MFITFWRWNISFFLLLWFPFICADIFWLTICPVCSLSMDTSQIRTKIASLPLLYNVWPNNDYMAIMSLKLLHTMEGNSSAVILHGPDLLKLQSEIQSEVREQKHNCHLQCHLQLCARTHFLQANLYKISSVIFSVILNSQTGGERRIDLKSLVH